MAADSVCVVYPFAAVVAGQHDSIFTPGAKIDSAIHCAFAMSWMLPVFDIFGDCVGDHLVLLGDCLACSPASHCSNYRAIGQSVKCYLIGVNPNALIRYSGWRACGSRPGSGVMMTMAPVLLWRAVLMV